MSCCSGSGSNPLQIGGRSTRRRHRRRRRMRTGRANGGGRKTIHRKHRRGRRQSRHRSFRRRRTLRHRGGNSIRRTRQRGGQAWKSGGYNPVGFSWSGNPATWPGVTGGSNGEVVSNHYEVSPCPASVGGIDTPISSRNLVGGGKRRRGQRGGFGLSNLFPQQVVNTWRDVTGKIWDTGYGYAGLTAPAPNHSDPTWQPIDKNFEYVGGVPVDVNASAKFAEQAVSKLTTN